MWWEEILSRNAQKIMQYINKFVCGMHCWQGPITCVWRRRNLGYPRDTTHQISNAPLPLTFLPTTRTTGLQSRTTHIPCFPPCEGISSQHNLLGFPRHLHIRTMMHSLPPMWPCKQFVAQVHFSFIEFTITHSFSHRQGAVSRGSRCIVK